MRRDVSFGLHFLFSHRAGNNTARKKILGWTPRRNCQQLDRLRDRNANLAAWLYSSKPVLCMRIRDQHSGVAQEASRKSRSCRAPRYKVGCGWSSGEHGNSASYFLLVQPRVLCTQGQLGGCSTKAHSQLMKGLVCIATLLSFSFSWDILPLRKNAPRRILQLPS